MSHLPFQKCYSEIKSERKNNFLGRATRAPILLGTAMPNTPSCSHLLCAELQGSAEAEWNDIRQRIRERVLSEIINIVDAAIEKAKGGHYQFMKYLLELAGLYPPAKEESGGNDCSLARALCDRLGLPPTPDLVIGENVLPESADPEEHGNGHALK
jgi:hypothetical protein